MNSKGTTLVVPTVRPLLALLAVTITLTMRRQHQEMQRTLVLVGGHEFSEEMY